MEKLDKGTFKDMICQNSRCAAIVGETDGYRLKIKGETVPHSPLMMSWNCFVCRFVNRWESKDYKNILKQRRK